MNLIQAKLKATSQSWIAAIILVVKLAGRTLLLPYFLT